MRPLEAIDVNCQSVVLAREELKDGTGDLPADAADGAVAQGDAEAAGVWAAEHLPPGEIGGGRRIAGVFLGRGLRAARGAPTGDSAPVAAVSETGLWRRALLGWIDVGSGRRVA